MRLCPVFADPVTYYELLILFKAIPLLCTLIGLPHKWCYLYILWYCYVAGFVTIGYIGGQERLFCSHKTLHLSFLDPSPFSQIMGKHCQLRMYLNCTYILIQHCKTLTYVNYSGVWLCLIKVLQKFKSNLKQLSCKNGCGPKKARVGKPKVAARKWLWW